MEKFCKDCIYLKKLHSKNGDVDSICTHPSSEKDVSNYLVTGDMRDMQYYLAKSIRSSGGDVFCGRFARHYTPKIRESNNAQD